MNKFRWRTFKQTCPHAVHAHGPYIKDIRVGVVQAVGVKQSAIAASELNEKIGCERILVNT